MLVGPSRCGKSTTLRCIASLEQPTDGEIVLDGTAVTQRKPKDRNMAFGLRMTTELSNEQIDTRVVDAAQLMGIENLLDKKPGELSGGQQQRVALGRAIVQDPEVFLMDEPLSNLDAKLRTQMRTELQDLVQDLNVTTIYVTHDQTEAMTMDDRIAILDDGELQQIGTPDQCYQQPSNQFVASFIGSPSMNFFDVELTDDTLVSEDFEIHLPERLQVELDTRGPEFTLGIRPEEILSEANAESSEGTFEANINVVEPLGDITCLHTDISGTETTVSVDKNTKIEVGDRIRVSFPSDQIHVFDKSTGESIINRGEPRDVDHITESQLGVESSRPKNTTEFRNCPKGP
nr:ABC transporter ATP-binding protein [Halocatena marina]